MSLTNIEAVRKWKMLPATIRRLLVDNVFCASCGVTTIIDYSVHNEKCDLLLKGKCKKCGNDVARLIENGFERHSPD